MVQKYNNKQEDQNGILENTYKSKEGLNEDIQEQKKQCKTEKNKGQNDGFKFYLISSYIKSKVD